MDKKQKMQRKVAKVMREYKAGGGDAQSLELVLKPLTNYLIRMTNVNGADHAGHLTLEWYE